MRYKINISAALFLLFLSLQFPLFSFSQSSKNAHDAIVMLKRGALFVKLKTSDNAINGLIERGRKDEAERLRSSQALENSETMQAFKKNFSFCKIYFFYSTNSAKIKDGNYKGCLINTSNEIDSSFTGSDYLIGEFNTSATNRIEAFIIEDKNFDQLKSPFPFMTRVNKNGVFTRTKDEIAKAVNDELTFFWNKTAGQ